VVRSAAVRRLALAPRCGSPAPSPDGRYVVAVSGRDGATRLWRFDRDGTGALPLTAPDVPVTAARWAPSGEWIAFTARTGGGTALSLMRPDGSGRRDLCTAGDLRLGGWTGDADAVVVAADLTGSGHRTVAVIPAAGGAVVDGAVADGAVADGAIAGGAVADGVVGPARDLVTDVAGGSALVVRELDRHRAVLLVVDLGTGTESVVLGEAEPVAIRDARFVAGGIGAICDAGSDRTGLVLFRLTDPSVLARWRRHRRIGRDDADLEACTAMPDGRLLLSWNVDGVSRLELRDPLSGRTAGPVVTPDPVVLGIEAFGDGGLVCHAGAADRPSTLWIGAPGTTRWRELPTGATASVAGLPLVQPRQVRIPAGGGITLDAWWYRPDGWPAGGPAVLGFHGGPAQQERPLFNPTYQALALAGIAVLAPNVRGSSGRGKRFAALDDGAARPDSLADIDACVAWLDGADGLAGADGPRAGRLGAFGASYGGFLALHAIRRRPDRFAAAVTLSAITDLPSFFTDASPWMRAASVAEYGDPARDAALLRTLSPIHDIAAGSVPVLVVHGRRDDNVPVSQALTLFRALRAGRALARLLVFDDEGHGVHREPNKVIFNRKVVGWFRRYLCIDARDYA
jgi:dipeptidyl aminopeptidase/acylaminoacyl peptidase